MQPERDTKRRLLHNKPWITASGSSSDPFLLCNLRQVISPIWALSTLVFLSVQKLQVLGLPLWCWWLGIRLPMQGAWIRSLHVRSHGFDPCMWDLTCRGATKPVHNYWSPWIPQPMLHNRRSPYNDRTHVAMKSSPRLLKLQRACEQRQRPSRVKNIHSFLKCNHRFPYL